MCLQMDEILGNEKGTSEQLITYVKDRRVMIKDIIDASKIKNELSWEPSCNLRKVFKKLFNGI